LEGFVIFQDRGGTNRDYWREMIELAYGGWNKHWEWGLATGNQTLVARGQHIRNEVHPSTDGVARNKID
jgi:hypothetical protein